LAYASSRGILLDLRIIFRTFRAVMTGHGAH
jgi:lipopolysaccharide/colanic/teichoic acid biosynthesis glycosyltransferase